MRAFFTVLSFLFSADAIAVQIQPLPSRISGWVTEWDQVADWDIPENDLKKLSYVWLRFLKFDKEQSSLTVVESPYLRN